MEEGDDLRSAVRRLREWGRALHGRLQGPPQRLPRKTVSAFDFTAAIRLLCEDICRDVEELGHVRMDDVAVGFSQTRRGGPHGIQASLTPLRFENGARLSQRRGRTYTIQTVLGKDGRESLYLLKFYLPRFLDLPFHEKMTTVVHELWHISPAFDGDLRRHPGRCYAHTGSQANYDAAMKRKAEYYLKRCQRPELHTFLRFNFVELQKNFGKIVGAKYRTPLLVPLTEGKG